MTFVYGSTLLSTIERISLDMEEAGMPSITDDQGNVLYSLSALATPIGKALRKGVENTVPEAAIVMKYLTEPCTQAQRALYAMGISSRVYL